MSDEDKTNSKVELEIRNSGSMTYGAPRIIEIAVRDTASGQLIVAIPMTANQFMEALAGTYHGRMPAWVVTPELRDRIGLKSVHKSVRLPNKISDLIPYGMDQRINGFSDLPGDEAANATVSEWILDQTQHEGWTEWRISRHNDGLRIHMTKYVDPSTVEPEAWEKGR